MAKLRFQDLAPMGRGKMAIEIADELFDIADDLEHKKLFRFADQLSFKIFSFQNPLN